MARHAFSLEHILFCVAAALGRRGFSSGPPDDLHRFLTRRAPDWGIAEDFEVTTVTSGLALLKQHPKLRTVVEHSLKPLNAAVTAFDNKKQFTAWLKNVEKEIGRATLDVTAPSTSELKALTSTARAIARRNLECRGSRFFSEEC